MLIFSSPTLTARYPSHSPAITATTLRCFTVLPLLLFLTLLFALLYYHFIRSLSALACPFVCVGGDKARSQCMLLEETLPPLLVYDG